MCSKFRGIRGKTFKLLDGWEIPVVGLGTYGLWSNKEVNEAVDAALANGYRLFDTANFYQNESELGNAFETLLPKHGLNRSDIFITTKANIRSPDVRKNAKLMIENSLNSLRTDYLDLVLIHYPKDWSQSNRNPSNPNHRAEMYKVLEEYKVNSEAGKIRSIGVSNFEHTHIDELWNSAKFRPVVNQCEFHPYFTRAGLVKYCKQKGIFFQAHTSLAKHSKPLYNEPIVKELSSRHNCTVHELILAFAYCQDIGVIPKSQKPEHISCNMKLINVKLTDEEVLQLNSLDKQKHYSDCDGWNVL